MEHGQYGQYARYETCVQDPYDPPPQCFPTDAYQNGQYWPTPQSQSFQPITDVPPRGHPRQLSPLSTWTSMLTTKNPPGYMAPPIAILHFVPPTKAPQLLNIKAHPGRTILTDEDRQNICQYHMENPTKKQTDIGDMFGVDRGTVSKILRQKEKYISPEDRSASPGKKPKGLPLTDAASRPKAQCWASTFGKIKSSANAANASGLEKCKQKSDITGNKKFPCKDCGKTYTRRSYLSWHRLNHKLEQIYFCGIGDCDRHFVREDLLKKHRVRHTAPRSQLQKKDVSSCAGMTDQIQCKASEDNSSNSFIPVYHSPQPQPLPAPNLAAPSQGLQHGDYDLNYWTIWPEWEMGFP